MTIIERPPNFRTKWEWKIELNPQSSDVVKFHVNFFGIDTVSLNESIKVKKMSPTSNRSYEFELSDGSTAKIYVTAHWNDLRAATFPHVELHHNGQPIGALNFPIKPKLNSKSERQQFWAGTFFWIGLIIAFINFASVIGFVLYATIGVAVGFFFGSALDKIVNRKEGRQ